MKYRILLHETIETIGKGLDLGREEDDPVLVTVRNIVHFVLLEEVA